VRAAGTGGLDDQRGPANGTSTRRTVEVMTQQASGGDPPLLCRWFRMSDGNRLRPTRPLY
jgi:hypothetical protein